jgi:nucleoside-diphosphate-sugar epimerase
VTFTILGASGFIGSHLAAALRARGVDPLTPARDALASLGGQDLGHVIFTIGLTGDFHRRPRDTVRAHVCRLLDVLETTRFESLLYLSSTRVYGAEDGGEDAICRIDSSRLSDLYNVSKLAGESLCLTAPDPRVRVARLSAVYGPDWGSQNFLMSVIRDAVDRRAVAFETSPRSAKDYIAVEDVVDLLIAIAERGTRRLYNVASGLAVTNDAIAGVLQQSTSCRVAYADGAPTVGCPRIDVSRIREEFAFTPRHLLDDLPRLVDAYKAYTRAH